MLNAQDGQQAWDFLERGDIRIAVLDWMMPQMSGPEICRKVREESQDRYTYLILLTAKGSHEDIVEGLNAGADDYVRKPFDRHELKARLQTGRRIIELETQLLETQEALHQIATHDGLTQVWNRAAVMEILDEEITRSIREKLPVGVIMADIDRFKAINDTHGHQAGDKVLIEVARRLKDGLRPYDKIGRYGGDEMLIVLPNCSLQNLESIALRLLSNVGEKAIGFKGKSLRASISIGGISSESIEDTTASLMIQESDKALYQAKEKGRNRFIISREVATIEKDGRG